MFACCLLRTSAVKWQPCSTCVTKQESALCSRLLSTFTWHAVILLCDNHFCCIWCDIPLMSAMSFTCKERSCFELSFLILVANNLRFHFVYCCCARTEIQFLFFLFFFFTCRALTALCRVRFIAWCYFSEVHFSVSCEGKQSASGLIFVSKNFYFLIPTAQSYRISLYLQKLAWCAKTEPCHHCIFIRLYMVLEFVDESVKYEALLQWELPAFCSVSRSGVQILENVYFVTLRVNTLFV